MKSIESLNHSLATHIIHCKSFSGPINTATQTTQLVGNLVSIIVLPLPNLLDKILSAQIMSSLSIVFQEHLLDNGLGGNTGMIRTCKNVM